MYHFGIGPGEIDFIVDDSLLKQDCTHRSACSRLIVGGIIYPIARCFSDTGLELADPIIDKHRKFLDQGGQFIVPLPEIKVVTS